MIGPNEKNLTPRECEMTLNGKPFRFLNQRSQDWTHLYEYEGSGATMTDAACGIFSICHAAEYLTGILQDPEALCDFSAANGGRCEDGTDRPALIKAMAEAGLDAVYGFSCGHEGNINDREALWTCLKNGGAALCNLRVGHIVALCGAREDEHGERQALVIDSLGESSDARVRNAVREILPESEIKYLLYNKQKLLTGYGESYAMFWVTLDACMNFDLLEKRY